jgi:hypothetical protein
LVAGTDAPNQFRDRLERPSADTMPAEQIERARDDAGLRRARRSALFPCSAATRDELTRRG